MDERREDAGKKERLAIWTLALAFGGQAVVTGVWAGKLEARIEGLTNQIDKLENRIIYLERK